jgi:hypothetical protein
MLETPFTFQGATPSESVASADNRALLVASGLLDEAWYFVRAFVRRRRGTLLR